jgi:hypothetical protein
MYMQVFFTIYLKYPHLDPLSFYSIFEPTYSSLVNLATCDGPGRTARPDLKAKTANGSTPKKCESAILRINLRMV